MPSIDKQRRSGAGRQVLEVYRDGGNDVGMPNASSQRSSTRSSGSTRKSRFTRHELSEFVTSLGHRPIFGTSATRSSTRSSHITDSSSEQPLEPGQMDRPFRSVASRSEKEKALPPVPHELSSVLRPPFDTWRMQSSSIPNLRRVGNDVDGGLQSNYQRQENQSIAHFPTSTPHGLDQLAIDVAGKVGFSSESLRHLDHNVWNRSNISRTSSSNSRPSLQEKPANVTHSRSIFNSAFGRNSEKKSGASMLKSKTSFADLRSRFGHYKPRESSQDPPSSSASHSSQHAKLQGARDDVDTPLNGALSGPSSRKASMDPSNDAEVLHPKVTALPTTASEMNSFAPDRAKRRTGIVGKIKGALGTPSSNHKRSATESMQELEQTVQWNLAGSPKLRQQFEPPVPAVPYSVHSDAVDTGSKKRNVLKKIHRPTEQRHDPFVEGITERDIVAATKLASKRGADVETTHPRQNLSTDRAPYDHTKPWSEAFQNTVNVEVAPRLERRINPLVQHTDVMTFAEPPPHLEESVRLAVIEQKQRAATPKVPLTPNAALAEDLKRFADQMAFSSMKASDLGILRDNAARYTMSLPPESGEGSSGSLRNGFVHAVDGVELRSGSLDSPRADQPTFPDLTGHALLPETSPQARPSQSYPGAYENRRRGMALQQSPLKRTMSTTSRWEFDASAAMYYSNDSANDSDIAPENEQDTEEDDEDDDDDDASTSLKKLKHLSMIPELNENRKSSSTASKRRSTSQLLESPRHAMFCRTPSRGESFRSSADSNAPSITGSTKTIGRRRKNTNLSISMSVEEQREISEQLHDRSQSSVSLQAAKSGEPEVSTKPGEAFTASGAYREEDDHDSVASDFSITSSLLDEADHYCEHEEPEIGIARAVEVVYIGRAKLVDIPPRRN